MTARQNRVEYLPTRHRQELNDRLTRAFRGMTDAIKAAPESIAKWFYNAGRPDGATHPKGWEAITAGQLVMRAALDTHDPEKIERTAELIAHYFDEMKAAALVDYLERSGGSLQIEIDETSRETSEAMHWMTKLAMRQGCLATLERTAREVREARDQCGRLLQRVETLLFVRETPKKHAASAR